MALVPDIWGEKPLNLAFYLKDSSHPAFLVRQFSHTSLTPTRGAAAKSLQKFPILPRPKYTISCTVAVLWCCPRKRWRPCPTKKPRRSSKVKYKLPLRCCDLNFLSLVGLPPLEAETATGSVFYSHFLNSVQQPRGIQTPKKPCCHCPQRGLQQRGPLTAADHAVYLAHRQHHLPCFVNSTKGLGTSWLQSHIRK